MVASSKRDNREAEMCSRFKLYTVTETHNISLLSLQQGHDVFLSTRTGSGKSLTYEYFPLVFPNTCVLVIAHLNKTQFEGNTQWKRFYGEH